MGAELWTTRGLFDCETAITTSARAALLGKRGARTHTLGDQGKLVVLLNCEGHLAGMI